MIKKIETSPLTAVIFTPKTSITDKYKAVLQFSKVVYLMYDEFLTDMVQIFKLSSKFCTNPELFNGKMCKHFNLHFLYFEITENYILMEYIKNGEQTNTLPPPPETLVMNGKYKKLRKKEDLIETYIFHNTKSNKTLSATSVVADFETANINGEYGCISYSIGSTSQSFFLTTTSLNTNDIVIEHFFEQIAELCKSKKGIHVYFHNLNYDGSYILKWMLKNKFTQLINNEDLYNKSFKIIYGNGIIQIETMINNKNIRISDTYRLMPLSIDAISKSFDSDIILKKSDTSFDYEKERYIAEKYNINEIAYCINDVVVASYIIPFFKKSIYGRVGITSAGTAYNEFKLSIIHGWKNTNNLMYFLQQMQKENELNGVILKFFTRRKNNKDILRDYYGENIEMGETLDETLKFIKNYKTNEPELEKYTPYYIFLKNKGYTDFEIMKLLNDNFDKSKRRKKKIEELFLEIFPNITENEDIFLRKSYYGGICSINPQYTGVQVDGIGCGIDINSSYPDKMVNKPMPYGYGRKMNANETIEFINTPEPNTTALIHVFGHVEMKKGEIPLFIDRGFLNNNTIYNGIIDRYITIAEYELLFKIYNAKIEIMGGYKFKTLNNIFYSYYKRYFKLKNDYAGTNLKPIVKILLNSLYGKFGENLHIRNGFVTICELESGALSFKEIDDEKKDCINTKYLPIAIFTTSYARSQLVGTAHKLNIIGSNVIYCDTDSIYFMCEKWNVKNGELCVNGNDTGININSDILGNWDVDDYSIKSMVAYAPKRYGVIYSNGSKKIKCAGINKNISKDFDINDLKYDNLHTTLQSSMGENGRRLRKKMKSLSYKNNIYLSENGTSIITDKYLQIGEIVEDTVHQKQKVRGIIYEKTN